MSYTIALDAMGGDHGPSVVVPAALRALSEFKQLKLILVGDRDAVAEQLQQQGVEPSAALQIHHTSQRVEMDDLPSHALRQKKDSSMRVAINLVKCGEADACVSAGNTGALMATARFVLKTLPGISRPAIISALPTMHGHVHMLDLGANVESDGDILFQFAVMGSVLTQAVDGVERPRVGLLNIGEEEMKGNESVKLAARRLAATNSINYIGYVEGDDIFKGNVDVVVCDGFVGNIALKTAEGVAKMISHYMKQGFQRTLWTRLAALVAMPVLRWLRAKIDPRRYNGASFVGLQGIVIKSHGGADVLAFETAIKEAVIEVDKSVPKMISQQLEQLLVKEAV